MISFDLNAQVNTQEFDAQTKETLLNYIKEGWFEKLNSLVNIISAEKLKEFKELTEKFYTELNIEEKTKLQSKLKSIEESILYDFKHYIVFYIGTMEMLQEKTEVFKKLCEKYKENTEIPNFIKNENTGKIISIWEANLLRIQNRPNATNGYYSVGAYLGTDGNIYFLKKSMASKQWPVQMENAKELDYNPIIAQVFFDFFDQPVAEYYLLKKDTFPYKFILTKNFLKKGQELIPFSAFYEGENNFESKTRLGRMKTMERNLEMRYKHLIGDVEFEKLINKLKLQYCIQEFMKLIIRVLDSNLTNTSIVKEEDEQTKKDEEIKIPEINISPAYDLDLSFMITKEISGLGIIFEFKDEEKQTYSIEYFIRTFQNIKGFKVFLKDFYEKICNETVPMQIVDKVIEKTNFKFFIEKRKQYVDFLSERFTEFRKAYENIFIRNGVDENAIVLE